MLDELIEMLSSTENSLTTILLKTKVLLFSIDQPDLVKWVNSELTGYQPEDELPEYRNLRAMVRGSIQSMGAKSDNFQLPTHHLKEEFRKSVEVIPYRDSLSVIEDLLRRSDADPSGGSGFRFPLPLEANGMFAKALASGWVVHNAWSAVDASQMASIITQVRSRLLDFLLALRSRVGENASNTEIKAKTTGLDISAAFQGAVFSGGNFVINFGDNNRSKITNLHAGTEQQLFEALEALGLGKADLKELQQAIAVDKKDAGGASLVGATGGWYQNLLAKAKKGAGKVSVEVVTKTIAGLIVEFIKNTANSP